MVCCLSDRMFTAASIMRVELRKERRLVDFSVHLLAGFLNFFAVADAIFTEIISGAIQHMANKIAEAHEKTPNPLYATTIIDALTREFPVIISRVRIQNFNSLRKF